MFEARIAVKWKRAVRMRFQTAWAPPSPIILALARRFPRLEFILKHWESGLCFKGVLQVRGKEVLKEETSFYQGGRGG